MGKNYLCHLNNLLLPLTVISFSQLTEPTHFTKKAPLLLSESYKWVKCKSFLFF